MSQINISNLTFAYEGSYDTVSYTHLALEEIVFEALKRQIEIVSVESAAVRKTAKSKGCLLYTSAPETTCCAISNTAIVMSKVCVTR